MGSFLGHFGEAFCHGSFTHEPAPHPLQDGENDLGSDPCKNPDEDPDAWVLKWRPQGGGGGKGGKEGSDGRLEPPLRQK